MDPTEVNRSALLWNSFITIQIIIQQKISILILHSSYWFFWLIYQNLDSQQRVKMHSLHFVFKFKHNSFENKNYLSPLYTYSKHALQLAIYLFLSESSALYCQSSRSEDPCCYHQPHAVSQKITPPPPTQQCWSFFYVDTIRIFSGDSPTWEIS